MSRHAVDSAQLGTLVGADGPRMTRILLEPPYVSAKGSLLAAVARANRCRAIELTGLHLSVVVGYAEDLAAVEVLFTSLMVQAANALASAGRGGDAGARTRSAAYRQSFHLGFAQRIGERLAAVGAAVLADQAAASSLPVLRSREGAVQDEVERLFGGRLSSSPIRGRHDPLGAAQGRTTADRARLHSGGISA